MVNSDAITKTTAAKVSANEMAFQFGEAAPTAKIATAGMCIRIRPWGGLDPPAVVSGHDQGAVNWACIATNQKNGNRARLAALTTQELGSVDVLYGGLQR